MLEVNIKELRKQLAEYIARVEAGEEIWRSRRRMHYSSRLRR